jgi:hypothetical protein
MNYSFSFTALAAQIPEMKSIAELYLKSDNWKEVESIALADNVLNKSKSRTTDRIFREIRKRITTLTADELNILINSNIDDQKVIVLISILKTYRIFYDFAFEILVPKYQSFDYYITDSDYINFVNSKMSIYKEFRELSETTLDKVRQRIFTILHQLGLIDSVKGKKIIKPFISDVTASALRNDNPIYLHLFLN